MISNNLEKTLPVGSVAKFLHIHSNIVRRWCNRGILTPHRFTHDGDPIIQRDDIARFLLQVNRNLRGLKIASYY